MKNYKEGDRIWLPADEENPDELGAVIEVGRKGMYVVEIDKQYRAGKRDDGLRDVHESLMQPQSKFESKIKSSNNQNKNTMKKSAKKSAKQSVKSSTKKAAKKAADRPAKKAAKKEGKPKKILADAGLTRGEAAEKLGLSIYAVDQLLAKKKLRSLAQEEVLKYKKSAK